METTRTTVPQGCGILCMATAAEEEITPLFVGRQDATIEKYVSIADADLGQPTLVLRGHRRAVTALVATSSDEVYSCSLDGTIKVWNADRDLEVGSQRVTRTIDLQTPLHCLALDEGRVYAGGQDGALKVVDGKRQSSWPGHSDVLCCMAFTSTGVGVTGSYDRQLRVWNLSTGLCIRTLTGHTNVVKAIAVVEPGEEADDEDGQSHTAIVSFGLDRRLLVWQCPSLDGVDEEDAARLKEATDLAFLDRYVGSWKRPAVAKHFPDLVPATEAATSGAFRSDSDEGDEETEKNDAALGDAEGAEMPRGAAGAEEEAPLTGDGDDGLAVDADTHADGSWPARMSTSKTVATDAPIASVELLEDPYVVDKKGESFVYVGGANGAVYGLKLRALAHKCFADQRDRQQAVRRAFRDARVSFKQARSFYENKYRKENQMEWKRVLRTATRKKNAEKKAAKEAAAKARAEQRAAIAAARAAAAEDEEDEEGDEYDDGDEEMEDDEAEEEVEDGIDDEEDGNGDAPDAVAQKQQEMVWHYLGEEEKLRYESLITANECQPIVLLKERSALLRRHLEETLPLLSRTYIRTAEQLPKLPWVTLAKAGVECVHAVVHDEGRQKVYASQESRVVPVNITVGVYAV